MTRREQTAKLPRIGARAPAWLPLLLLYAFVAWAAATPLSAQTEGQSPDTQSPADQTPVEETAEELTKGDSTPASDAKEEDAEAGTRQSAEGEKQADDSPSEDPPKPDSKSESSESPDKKEPAKKQEPAKEAEPEATEEKDGDKAEDKQEKPDTTSETTVEDERTMEVEPPKAEEKKPTEKPADPPPKKEKCTIGSTATLLEKQSGIKFRARVDTGAKTCSLHVEKITIQDESTKEDIAERMTENIGKVISFVVKNGDGKTHILKRKIASYVIIKTSNKKEGKRRYKVPLTFIWKNMEKEVLVTLNDRQHMEFPLLIGRNFLRGDFLVDVELDSAD